MAPRPPIHYRRIPGTRRYYNPITLETVSEYRYRKYRATLTPEQLGEVSAETRRVATWRNSHRSDVAGIYQRKVESTGGTYDANARREFGELYARLQQLKIQESSLIGLPDKADELKRLRDKNGEYAQILEELGRRPVDADYDVGQSPEGTVSALWPTN